MQVGMYACMYVCKTGLQSVAPLVETAIVFRKRLTYHGRTHLP